VKEKSENRENQRISSTNKLQELTLKGGEMTQALYAHMNNKTIKIKKKKRTDSDIHGRDADFKQSI
jgi:hypothetical protein